MDASFAELAAFVASRFLDGARFAHWPWSDPYLWIAGGCAAGLGAWVWHQTPRRGASALWPVSGLLGAAALIGLWGGHQQRAAYGTEDQDSAATLTQQAAEATVWPAAVLAVLLALPLGVAMLRARTDPAGRQPDAAWRIALVWIVTFVVPAAATVLFGRDGAGELRYVHPCLSLPVALAATVGIWTGRDRAVVAASLGLWCAVDGTLSSRREMVSGFPGPSLDEKWLQASTEIVAPTFVTFVALLALMVDGRALVAAFRRDARATLVALAFSALAYIHLGNLWPAAADAMFRAMQVTGWSTRGADA